MANTVSFGHSEDILRFAETHVEHINGKEVFNRENARAVCMRDQDGKIIAAIVYDNWDDWGVEVTIATDGTKRWATRDYLAKGYSYPLETCGKLRMTMVTAMSNTAAINMHKALNHPVEGVLRDWFGPGQDALIYGFTKQDWQKSKYNPLNQRKEKE